MKIITAPEEGHLGQHSLFLAGGISNCGDWQSKIIALLADTDLTLINPRRPKFDMNDPTVTEAQIAWEYRYLRQATVVLFWFPPETLCPITLFELGGALERKAQIFIGCHSAYARREDVRTQVALRRPEVSVVDSVVLLAEQVQACHISHD